jgi:AAA+ superfamily predicted ATPase
MMDMEFLTRRPSLPLGFQLGNLPPVQRALHSDELVEVYLLERPTRADLLLIREAEAKVTRLREWWDILGPDIVVDPPSDSTVIGPLVLRLSGSWWPENQIHRIDDVHWRSFLLGSLNLLRTAHQMGLRPKFIPTLMWLAPEAQMLLPLCVTRGSASEEDILHDFAAVLISASTGIHLASIPADVDALGSWNKCIPSDLFPVFLACLANQGQNRISCFEAFEDRITDKTQVHRWAPCCISDRSSKSGLDNIAGMQELKEWLRKEILGPLRNPEAYQKYRIGIPNGILFYGPPGCGKTYVARQLAEELGYFFQEIKPSDVASPYIHSTVLRIRELFDEAIERAPSILFIDEFDAFAPSRSELGGHQQYKSEEVNEFLANLEGAAGRRVLVIAATNAPEKIDPAIRRSGRFDKLVFIPPPDSEARRAMLEHHLAGRPVETKFDLPGVAVVLDGYSASDLKLLVDEAARLAFELEAPISTEMLLNAIRRVPPSITTQEQERYSAFQARGF